MPDYPELECRIVVVHLGSGRGSIDRANEELSHFLSRGLEIYNVKFRKDVLIYTLIGPKYDLFKGIPKELLFRGQSNG